MENYRERLAVPVSWWLLLGGLTASVWVVYHHAYGPSVSIPVGLGLAALGAVLLLAYGALTIRVDDAGFRVGRAVLPLSAVGDVAAFSGPDARAARGHDLDPRAFTALRGYVDGVVRARVADPADPTPYWVVSTRRPERLVAVLEAARQGTGTGE